MKNARRIIFALAIASAVGITYVINSFKNFPDIFDVSEENDEDDNEF